MNTRSTHKPKLQRFIDGLILLFTVAVIAGIGAISMMKESIKERKHNPRR